jgi:PAS domain S-box-containing protein
MPIRALDGCADADARSGPLRRWVTVADGSLDACIVVDDEGRIAAGSQQAAELLGVPPGSLVGRLLVEDVLQLVDFTRAAAPGDHYQGRIPPVAVLRDDHLSRGLLRLLRPDGDLITLDAVAAPIHDDQRRVVGSITFFAAI